MAAANGVLSPGAVPEPEPYKPAEPEWQENLNIHLTCPDCREVPPDLYEDYASGDTICASCGLVLASHLVDTRSEWRTFSNDDQGGDDPSRVGEATNPLLNGSQLETSISFGDGGARSRELHRAQNKATQDKSQKSLLAAYKQISALCDAYSIPHNVKETANTLYKMVDDAKAFKGKSTDSIIASCLFIGCRQEGVPRSFREIHDMTHVSKKEIGRTFKALEKFFAAQNKHKGGTQVSAIGLVTTGEYKETTSTQAAELCIRFCSKLGLSHPCTMLAEHLAHRAAEVGNLAGRSPLSTISACIYMASHLVGDPKTPKDIAPVTGVSDGTIRTAYKGLYEKRDELMSNNEYLTSKGGDMSRLPPG